MESRYVYKGQDIAMDVFMKIESVVQIIAAKESRGFDVCYNDFLYSKAYEALSMTDSLMWAESAEFIVDEYYRAKA